MAPWQPVTDLREGLHGEGHVGILLVLLLDRVELDELPVVVQAVLDLIIEGVALVLGKMARPSGKINRKRGQPE